MIENNALPGLLKILPIGISFAVSQYKSPENIEEIHISKDKKAFIKTEDGIKLLEYRAGEKDISDILAGLTASSLYAHFETINEGYIVFRNGVRVGVCGNAVCEKGKIISVDKIESINIRIPHLIRNISEPVISALEFYSFRRGLLVYSLPGVGKTTVLRDAAFTLSSFPYYKRVCLIDTRGELSGANDCPLLDVYKGYPPCKAIEMSTRTMSPEIIVCDEIGGDDEYSALFSLCGKGISVLASAHAGCFEDLFLNQKIKSLHEGGLFACYVGLTRKNKKLYFNFNTREDTRV